MFKQIKIADVFIFILFVGIAVLSLVRTRNSVVSSLNAIITVGDDKYVYSLKENTTIKLKGTVGVSTLKIENGEVWFVDSPCPDKICCQMGHASHYGDFIACLPNRVIVTIEENEKENDKNARQTDN